MIAVLALHAAVLLEPLDGIGIQHFAPDIGVITGGVAADDMGEIGAAVTWRNGIHGHACGFKGAGLEIQQVFGTGDFLRGQLVQGLIEQ